MGHQIDWSATAAWIALAISIISPAITTILTNRHQLKLRELDIQEKHSSTYNAARASTIEDFISKVGKYISYSSSSARNVLSMRSVPNMLNLLQFLISSCNPGRFLCNAFQLQSLNQSHIR